MPLLSLSSQFYGFEAFSQIETITSSSSKVLSEHYFVEVLENPSFFFNSIFIKNGYLHFASKMRIAFDRHFRVNTGINFCSSFTL